MIFYFPTLTHNTQLSPNTNSYTNSIPQTNSYNNSQPHSNSHSNSLPHTDMYINSLPHTNSYNNSLPHSNSYTNSLYYIATHTNSYSKFLPNIYSCSNSITIRCLRLTTPFYCMLTSQCSPSKHASLHGYMFNPLRRHIVVICFVNLYRVFVTITLFSTSRKQHPTCGWISCAGCSDCCFDNWDYISCRKVFQVHARPTRAWIR